MVSDGTGSIVFINGDEGSSRKNLKVHRLVLSTGTQINAAELS